MTTCLALGLTGGFHCVAMCGAPCARLACSNTLPRQDADSVTSRLLVHEGAAQLAGPSLPRLLVLHGGRLMSYAALGALAGGAVGGLAQFVAWSQALRPLWALFQLVVLFAGFGLLLWGARPPDWVVRRLHPLGARMQRWLQSPSRLGLAGLAWAGLPCGLLYSAAAIAALTGRVLDGALAMVLFGLGSTLWLLAAPWLLRRMQGGLNAWRQELGARLAGIALVGMSGWALWNHAMHGAPRLWC
ncbi:sulfite exporter TauE/SafE family protein [Comamonas testosteroni]